MPILREYRKDIVYNIEWYNHIKVIRNIENIVKYEWYNHIKVIQDLSRVRQNMRVSGVWFNHSYNCLV